MEHIRTWGLRLVAILFLAFAALSIGALLETNQVAVRFTRGVAHYKGLAAVAVPIVLIGCSLVAFVASLPRFGESKQLRLCAALLVVLGVVLFLLGYGSGDSA